ncbi:Hypothetical Protein FCC1311_005813 [Hondaea fermentalgiana]|uniref:Uncharacterized protein n=1 Tax=Hondaea fermentalgiana TaxID=2315210 RepID=A0A2R5GQX0_9STRA|nr:Hypothetical Protein FCC1311_005813 [Hondaea fermentalgiana]|eukprot:GBG32995.1 Hypothetical Protein FCC1311_005813 [Hondaea fermentalgiana]
MQTESPRRPAPRRGTSRRERPLLKKLRSRGHGTLNESDVADARNVDTTEIDLQTEDFREEFGNCGQLPARYEVVRYTKVALAPRAKHQDVKGRYSLQTARGRLTNGSNVFSYSFDVPVDRKSEVIVHVLSPCRVNTLQIGTLLQKLSDNEHSFSSEASTLTMAST